ncbi:MAG: DUF3168 domain-containing protein [Alphaproteobacteria bacterium]|nr:MAG: DUF3168 domain-containing protein [Alphaproteobacteria bacterium]
MSARLGPEVQAAIHAMLSADAAVSALTGGAIHDAPPPGPVPALWVRIGEERVRDASDASGRAAVHEVVVEVSAEAGAFAAAKEAAAAICDALEGRAPALSGASAGPIGFVRAEARRARDGRRLVRLVLRLRVDEP